MCGICGIISFDAEPVSEVRLQACCDAMRHRGPNDQGIWTHGTGDMAAGLAAVRLAVQDPSYSGHQPMQDESGRYLLVFNGEVYNARELRCELDEAGEFPWRSNGDTEVVLAACIRWGTNALLRFNGMWALGFFDRDSGAGFLSRDRFGIKPLYYAERRGTLRFASEMRALSALGPPARDIDPHALAHHLQFGFIPHPHTIEKSVRQLEPGHLLRFSRGGVERPEPYFHPLADIEPNGAPPSDYRAALRRAIGEAVACRRVSDVPIGAFHSGGLDSSIIVAHLSQVIGRPIKTFAVGYAGQRAYDERAYARLAAARFGTDHHEIVVTESDAVQAVYDVLDHVGEPVGDASIVPTSLVSAFAARSVTVALSGDGADELFGGYWRYTAHAAYESYRRIPSPIRRYLFDPSVRRMGSSKSTVWGNRLRQIRKLLRADSDDPMARHIAWARILSPEAATIFRNAGTDAETEKRVLARTGELTAPLSPSCDPLHRILCGDLQYQLPADMLHKVDLASMMHSLEVRVPFLDPSVVRAALALPVSARVHRGLRKRALVHAYRGRLPDEILDRGKQGFELPVGEFLRTQLRDAFRDIVNRHTIESFGLLSYDAVQHVYREHLDRRAEHGDLLFAMLSLCHWAQATR